VLGFLGSPRWKRKRRRGGDMSSGVSFWNIVVEEREGEEERRRHSPAAVSRMQITELHYIPILDFERFGLRKTAGTEVSILVLGA
jgi:hypothetical protein